MQTFEHAIVSLFTCYEKSEDRCCVLWGVLPFLRILGARNADVHGVEAEGGLARLTDMAYISTD